MPLSPIPSTLPTSTYEHLVLEALNEIAVGSTINYNPPILDTALFRHLVLNALQYIANNPSGGGGGAFGAVYYFNRSNASSISGYYEMSKNLVIGAGTTLTATGSGTQLVGSFATVLNDPNVTTIPSGNWNFENYVSISSNGGTPKIYGEIYKRNLAGTETLIATNISNPHVITGGTINELYLWSIPVPATIVLTTDRLVVKFYALDLGGRTMTMHFEDANVAQTTTSLPSVDLSAYVLKAGDTMTGKLIVAADATASKLNIGSSLGSPAPTSLVDGDIWISNQNKFTFRSSGATITTAGTSQSNTFSQPQIIGSTSNVAPILTTSNTGTREIATFTNTATATSDAVVITNLGSGNSLVINDEPATDLTRFVVSNTGRVGIGVTPDATVALSVDSTGIKFGDGTIQTTAGVAKTGDTMTGKLIAAADDTSSKLNIGIITGTSPTTTANGDLWITGGNRIAWRSGGVSYSSTATNLTNTFNQPQIISTSNASAALRVTQTGAGEALRVEDESPDTTPFVVSASGRVGVGVTPDASVALSVDTTGIKFGDNTIQATAAVAGVTSISAGTTGLTPATATTGAVTLAGTLAIANGGTGSTTTANALTALGAVAKAGDTMTGKLNLPASTTLSAPINIGTGSDPTSPSNGDIWLTGSNLTWKGTSTDLQEAAALKKANIFTRMQAIQLGATDTGIGLKITNLGSGESLRIEDESPESTPFVVSASGRVGIGVTPDATVALSVDLTGIKFSTGALVLSGVGSPEGVISAPLGSMYLNSSGGTGSTLWVKESGTSTNTGWVSK